MITIEHLTKYYGDFMAVNDLSFEIEEGHVYGFLGPNGAGKSTTMNIMTGCLSATDGTVKIYGHDIFEEPQMAKKLIGYLPEQPPLYMNETPVEYLKFVGEAKGLKGVELAQQVEEVIEQTKISSVRNKLIQALSKGYRQRVGIAQALLGNPKVIILDEPTKGVDVGSKASMYELMSELASSGCGILMISSEMPEILGMCDRILVMREGRISGECEGREVTQEDILKKALPVNKKKEREENMA